MFRRGGMWSVSSWARGKALQARRAAGQGRVGSASVCDGRMEPTALGGTKWECGGPPLVAALPFARASPTHEQLWAPSFHPVSTQSQCCTGWLPAATLPLALAAAPPSPHEHMQACIPCPATCEAYTCPSTQTRAPPSSPPPRDGQRDASWPAPSHPPALARSVCALASRASARFGTRRTGCKLVDGRGASLGLWCRRKGPVVAGRSSAARWSCVAVTACLFSSDPRCPTTEGPPLTSHPAPFWVTHYQTQKPCWTTATVAATRSGV